MPHDGRLELILGDPGAGKDSFIYHLVHNRPFVLVQGVPNNETMDQLFYLTDTDKNMDTAFKVLQGIHQPAGYPFTDKDGNYMPVHNFAIFFREEETDPNEKLWRFMKACPLLWLGDVNFWGSEWHRSKKFEVFVRNIRGRNQLVYGSTHRTKADLPPFVYQYARKIYWVGPFTDDQSELKKLYGKKSTGLFTSEQEFEQKIRNLERFNALDPNPEKSVLTIKDLTG